MICTLYWYLLYQPVLLCLCCQTCLCCSAASQFTMGGLILVRIFVSVIIYPPACVCDSQTYYVHSERDTLNATQLKLMSLNSSLTKLLLDFITSCAEPYCSFLFTA